MNPCGVPAHILYRRFIMDFDLSAITSKLAVVMPYLSYIINLFTQMFNTMQGFLNS